MAPIFYKTINDVVSSDSRKFLPLFIFIYLFYVKKKKETRGARTVFFLLIFAWHEHARNRRRDLYSSAEYNCNWRAKLQSESIRARFSANGRGLFYFSLLSCTLVSLLSFFSTFYRVSRIFTRCSWILVRLSYLDGYLVNFVFSSISTFLSLSLFF